MHSSYYSKDLHPNRFIDINKIVYMKFVLKSNGITKIVIFLSYSDVCYPDLSDFLNYQLFAYFCDVEPRDFFMKSYPYL